MLCYTPEDGISLDLLRKDVEFLRKRYELDQHGKSEGRLVIKQVSASFEIGIKLTDLIR